MLVVGREEEGRVVDLVCGRDNKMVAGTGEFRRAEEVLESWRWEQRVARED